MGYKGRAGDEGISGQMVGLSVTTLLFALKDWNDRNDYETYNRDASRTLFWGGSA